MRPLLLIAALSFFASACSVEGERCRTAADCEPSEACAVSGGVFFAGRVCVVAPANSSMTDAGVDLSADGGVDLGDGETTDGGPNTDAAVDMYCAPPPASACEISGFECGLQTFTNGCDRPAIVQCGLCTAGLRCSEGSCIVDEDRDDVPDGVDNCPGQANTDQIDTDGDGVGDACDNCQLHPNPDQADADGDMVADACEMRLLELGEVQVNDSDVSQLTLPRRDVPEGDVLAWAIVGYNLMPGLQSVTTTVSGGSLSWTSLGAGCANDALLHQEIFLGVGQMDDSSLLIEFDLPVSRPVVHLLVFPNGQNAVPTFTQSTDCATGEGMMSTIPMLGAPYDGPGNVFIATLVSGYRYGWSEDPEPTLYTNFAGRGMWTVVVEADDATAMAMEYSFPLLFAQPAHYVGATAVLQHGP